MNRSSLLIEAEAESEPQGVNVSSLCLCCLPPSCLPVSDRRRVPAISWSLPEHWWYLGEAMAVDWATTIPAPARVCLEAKLAGTQVVIRTP